MADSDPSRLIERFLEHLKPKLADLKVNTGAFRLIDSRGPFLPDESTKAIIDDKNERPSVVLFVSPESGSAIVGRAIERSKDVAEMLGPALGSVVIVPLLCGEFESRSYAVLPYQRTLESTRWKWRLQRLWLAPRLFRWLRAVVRATASDAQDAQLAERVFGPLESLANDERFSMEIRRNAEFALTRVASGRWRPKLMLVHGDLWKGNILLPRDRESRRVAVCGFSLIDWGGAQLRGVPFWDLAQLGESFALPPIWARHEVRRHASLLDCESEDALCYLALGIADLGGRLEHMPVELYVQGAERLYRFLRSSVGSRAPGSPLPRL